MSFIPSEAGLTKEQLEVAVNTLSIRVRAIHGTY